MSDTVSMSETVGRRDLVRQVAAELGTEEDQAGRVVDSLLERVKEHLLAGRQVNLKDFASIKVVEEKAHIVKDPETGHQFIRPVGKKVAFTPTSSFKRRVEQTKLASILLAVPKDDPFARVVHFHFSRVGWNVHVFHDIDEGLRRVSERGAYMTIVDYALPGATRLIQELKCTRQTSLIPLIVLFPSGTDPERASDFRVCGDEHLVEPFEIYTLLTVAESELARSSEEEVIFDQQVCFQFPTREEYIERAIDLGMKLFRGSGLADEGQTAMGAAFREAVGNAAQHGNKDDAAKQVKVLYLLDKEKVTVVITDEGTGFDHDRFLLRGETSDAVSAARERHAQGRAGGLGIMLMLRCVDKLEYNEQGNMLTLTKYLKAR